MCSSAQFVMPAQRSIASSRNAESPIVCVKKLGGALAMLDRVFVAAEVKAGQAKVNPHLKGIRIQAQRFRMRRQSLIVAPKLGKCPPPGGMSLGQGRIDRERPFGG